MKVLQSTTSTSPVLHEVPPVGFEPTQFALVELELLFSLLGLLLLILLVLDPYVKKPY